MVIELLKFQVDPEVRENYIHKDAEIWTTGLAKYPGFLGKEVWINPNDPTELILIIRWSTREQWKAISLEALQMIEDKFTQAMGKSYPIVESAEYQVQKIFSSQSNIKPLYSFFLCVLCVWSGLLIQSLNC